MNLRALFFSVTFASSSAVAAEPEPEPKAPPPLHPAETQHIAFGLTQGVWGTGFGQTLNVDFSFFRFFGVRLRGLAAYGPPQQTDVDMVFAGGLELFGRSNVLAGCLRVYGGGGLYAGGRPVFIAGDTSRRYGFAGGGHMGIEVIANDHLSFTVEIGGQSAIHPRGLDGGPSVMGGAIAHF